MYFLRVAPNLGQRWCRDWRAFETFVRLAFLNVADPCIDGSALSLNPIEAADVIHAAYLRYMYVLSSREE